ncbi:MAG: sigma-54-dependent transcriptional regulator [Bdellovibrionales bacterium]
MSKHAKILVIDDEKPIREILSASLEDENYQVDTASNGQEGLDKIKSFKPNIVLLDIWMPGDLDGIDVLREAKVKLGVASDFIVMSGHGNIETAVKATKLGAWDFVEKPISLDKIHILLNNILAFQKERLEKASLLNKLRKSIAIVGDTPRIRDIKEKVAKLGPNQKAVLVTGASGSGKELLAENIHYFSQRASATFASVSCSVTPEELIDSEIFGYDKSKFTGSETGKLGKLYLSRNGTLYIKEAHLLPKTVQQKLLDYIRSSKGSSEEKSFDVDVRLVFGSSKTLAEIRAGDEIIEEFWDLLVPNHFDLPDLKTRKDDIPALMDHFAGSVSKEGGYDRKNFTDNAFKILSDHHWPGHIRELRNFVERIYILVGSDVIDEADLEVAGLMNINAAKEQVFTEGSLKEARASFERDFILQKLQEFEGNVSKTAESIGVERSHLHRKIKGYGIDV